MITLGKEVENIITNQKGYVISRIEFLSGIIQYGVQYVPADGEPILTYVDEPYLLLTGKSITMNRKKLEMGFHG